MKAAKPEEKMDEESKEELELVEEEAPPKKICAKAKAVKAKAKSAASKPKAKSAASKPKAKSAASKPKTAAKPKAKNAKSSADAKSTAVTGEWAIFLRCLVSCFHVSCFRLID